jgi:ABC-type antimicrobial peptide transport system permease subunit
MRHDLRQALRLLRLNPGFATLAILTPTIGIAACVTMFSIVHGVLLRPLPYAQPDRMVALWEVSERGLVAIVALATLLTAALAAAALPAWRATRFDPRIGIRTE